MRKVRFSHRATRTGTRATDLLAPALRVSLFSSDDDGDGDWGPNKVLVPIVYFDA